MPAQAPFSSIVTADHDIEVSVMVDLGELRALQRWASERVFSQFELAEDLRALGRPYDDAIKLAALALRVAACFDTTGAS